MLSGVVILSKLFYNTSKIGVYSKTKGFASSLKPIFGRGTKYRKANMKLQRLSPLQNNYVRTTNPFMPNELFQHNSFGPVNFQ